MNKYYGKIIIALVIIQCILIYTDKPAPEPFPYVQTDLGQLQPGIMHNR